jgi:type VI secretion system protein ImpK
MDKKDAPIPFNPFESERTIIKPRPKLAAQESVGASAGFGQIASTAIDLEPVDIVEGRVLNPVVSAASELLGLFSYLRQLPQAPNAANLRGSLVTAVQRFETTARKSGVSEEQIIGSRYMLCTAIDEGVANTPWGAQASWNQQSLLVQFHNETWGGEKVFQLLAKLAQDVPKNIDLLELLYCILGLGFEGRYRVTDNGRSQLESVRQRLADLITKHRGAPESDLSPHWKSRETNGNKTREPMPFWIVAAGIAALLGIVFVGTRLALNHRSDSTYEQVASLKLPGAVNLPSLPVVPAKKPRFAGFLEAEVKEGRVTLIESADRSIIRLAGDQFFASGSAEPLPNALATLLRIGDALAKVPGEVLINGHSDNQPIRSIRFPSNWHLSAARADSVKNSLIAQVDPSRMKIAGKAESEPLALNDSAEHRAKNRRVDIILIPAELRNEPGATAGVKP